MNLLYEVLVVLHFIGMAGLLGGILVGVSEKPLRIKVASLHSGLLVLLAGIFLIVVYAMQHAKDDSVELLDHTKLWIKLNFVVAILVLGFLNVKKAEVKRSTYMTIFGLAVANVLIAVFW
ncbi:MAG: hypothetical protein ACKO29_02595 [Actinomycetota bacterium]